METQQITITEEAFDNSPNVEITLELPVEQVTVRELIRSRVYQAVKDRNLRVASQPDSTEQFELGETEVTLNGPKKKRSESSDWKPEFDKACRAFQKNQILVLVDGKQMTKLDDELNITPNSDVRFLRLTLLMGG